MIINFNALFKLMGISRTSYLAKQIRYAIKGASVLTNKELDNLIKVLKVETNKIINHLEKLKKND